MRCILLVLMCTCLVGCDCLFPPAQQPHGLTVGEFRDGMLDFRRDVVDPVAADVATLTTNVNALTTNVTAQGVQIQTFSQLMAQGQLPQREDVDEDNDGPSSEERRLRRQLAQEEDRRLRAEMEADREADRAMACEEEAIKARRRAERVLRRREFEEPIPIVQDDPDVTIYNTPSAYAGAEADAGSSSSSSAHPSVRVENYSRPLTVEDSYYLRYGRELPPRRRLYVRPYVRPYVQTYPCW